MAGTISQRERTILQDQLRHEEVCIRKYTDYSRRVADPALRGLFNEFAQDEREHYNSLNSLLGSSSVQGQPTADQTGTLGTGRVTGATNDEFIRRAAEQRLGSRGIGQSQQVTGQQTPVQSPQYRQTLQGDVQSAHVQTTPQLQQPAPTRQPAQQNRPGAPSPQPFEEASHELIPMFGSETAREFMGASGEDEAQVARDMLMTEQFVSGSYDSAIFDSISPQIRLTLQHIQEDEQKHGQGLRDYLQQRGMSQ